MVSPPTRIVGDKNNLFGKTSKAIKLGNLHNDMKSLNLLK